MIIKRIASALRRQDWFQVSVEILIVVVGIYLGLQVDDWNQGRQDKIEGDDYLERIYQDLNADIVEFNRHLVVAKIKRLGLLRVEGMIKTGVPLADVPEAEISVETLNFDGFYWLSYSTVYGWSFPDVKTTTFRDIQNSGKMSLIDNVDLRFEISDYYESSLNAGRRIRARITGYPQAVYEIIYGGARTAFNATIVQDPAKYDEEGFNTQISMEQFMQKANNEEFLKRLNAEKNYTIFIIDMINDQIQKASDVATMIEREKAP